MLQVSNLLVLFLLAGSSYAVFYTKSTHNEYPRIGRRAFYTSGNGYPRIGRRDGAEVSSAETFDDVGQFEKRGIFTSGGGYPRVGRSGGLSDDIWENTKSKLLRNIAALTSHVEESGESGLRVGSSKEEISAAQEEGLNLDLLFMALDENDDNQLSKAEFTSGMEKYHQDSPLC